MPTTGQILAGLHDIANAWPALAIAWHGWLGAVVGGLALGWRPMRVTLGWLLFAPIASVALHGFAAGNPFNGTVCALLAAGSIATVTRGTHRVTLADSRIVRAAAGAMIAFGWLYPHFLDAWLWQLVVAAPLGLIPCPTLAAVIGLVLLCEATGEARQAILLAAGAIFYGLFGVLVLGVTVDLALIAGAIVLLLAVRPLKA
jgi:hypothetical protein